MAAESSCLFGACALAYVCGPTFALCDAFSTNLQLSRKRCVATVTVLSADVLCPEGVEKKIKSSTCTETKWRADLAHISGAFGAQVLEVNKLSCEPRDHCRSCDADTTCYRGPSTTEMIIEE
ncbi:hypothetical protein PR003_g24052 [Phytophthora rubi]|uniref:Secreted protein n=1 Tax=Phytophthora rubi TaxID=129364 RepID=A0A6A3J0N9_9STRA|nr:hypothetical protein PR002_g23342 [Phytophthora rubi]KAE8986105.1 hypothetical protein PR001_g22690 [Phytophthora rubi]KAE9295303.1 hypothetical protein PR003_g24052 [Phytophthora rubi]